MESNKENEVQQLGGKTNSNGLLTLPRTKSSGGESLARGAKENRGFMRRILQGTGVGGGTGRTLRNTTENISNDAGPSLAPSNLQPTARPPGGAKKNFVKANMLAASSTRSLRSTTLLTSTTPSLPVGLHTTSSRLGASSHSLNSETRQ